jgi:molybdate transport system substrate-binding protein
VQSVIYIGTLRSMLMVPRFGWAAMLGTLLSVTASHARADSVLVFAAASAAPAIRAASASFTERTGTTVTVSGAATSTLAQQIIRGAPAQIFVSAHPRWINHLAERNLIDQVRQTTLLGNHLVLIAHKESNMDALNPASGSIAAALGKDGRLAIGDPDHVPAGLYAKQALTTLGVWNSIAKRLAPAGDVVAALTFVARGEAPIGIVYRTDVGLSDAVHIIGSFPPDSHEVVRYDIAPVRANTSDAATVLLRHLTSEAARPVFERFGFIFLPKT